MRGGTKIKNEEYLRFLNEGIINIIKPEDIYTVLNNIDVKKDREEARSLIIILYLTGCRPAEALNIKSKDIELKDKYVVVKIATLKRGVPRSVYLQKSNALAYELYNYAKKIYPDAFIFFHFRSRDQNHKVSVKLRSGIKKFYDKPYSDVSHRLRYYIPRWFKIIFPKGMSAYFLRHNRFSQLASEDVDLLSLQQLKGSRNINSVMPYVHMSTEKAKKTARKIK